MAFFAIFLREEIYDGTRREKSENERKAAI
jgi:hypothetical protein